MLREPKDRLKAARVKAGYKSAAKFAEAHGLTETLYRANENGSRNLTLGSAKRYAPLLGVSWQWLLEGDADQTPGPSEINHSVSNKTNFGTKHTFPAFDTEDRIKVLGMAECGPDGWALWNGEVVDMVPRPPNLAGAKDAYAVFIVGDSMENRYHPGEIAHIHPGKPVGPGCYVLVQMHPKNGESTPRAFLKRLVKRSGDKVVFEQSNPHKTFNMKTSEIQSMHRVVGSSEA